MTTISPFIDVLEDFHAVDVVELSMFDDHMLMFIHISTKSYYLYKVGVYFYHTPLHHKP